MKQLCFKLSMPNIGSWNGKWTGESNLYAIIRKFYAYDNDKTDKILDKGYFYYNFGDGWGAGVTVTEVKGKEANKIRKHSNGFCGYDWMVNSIINDLEIKTD